MNQSISVGRGVKVHLPVELFTGIQVRALLIQLRQQERTRGSQPSGLSNGRSRPQVAGQVIPLPPRVALLKELNPAHIHLKANLEAVAVPRSRAGAPGAAVPVLRSNPAVGEVPPVPVQVAVAAVLAAVLEAVAPVAVVLVEAAHDLSIESNRT
jgi:hypothetical protein